MTITSRPDLSKRIVSDEFHPILSKVPMIILISAQDTREKHYPLSSRSAAA
jgi:hypothetical protein